MINELFRKIPKVDNILKNEKIENLLKIYGKDILKKIIDEVLKEIREKIKLKKAEEKDVNENRIIENIVEKTEKFFSQKLKRVINATGIVLHTNLGRAPISEKILNEAKEVLTRYSNLELSLKTGKRSIRYQNVIEYFQKLTDCEDCLIVNNNASAVLLSLSALAKGKEVIISRGELIEIGGSFRIPEVMAQSGAILKEVGTTNKTKIEDYINAINENTGLILKVHTSNYRIIGFTQSVNVEELIKLGEKYNIPVMEDLGSGCLIDLTKYGLPDEPLVQDEIKKGVDILTFSGDKLLGGPQAGIILGKKKYIEILKKHPLNRALRIDKWTMAILERTIKRYFNEEIAKKEITALNFISKDLNLLKEKAEALCEKLKKVVNDFEFYVEKDFSYVGGGAFPMNRIETFVVVVKSKKYSAGYIDEKLRKAFIPIKGRIKDEKYLLDVRTIFDDEIEIIEDVFKKVFL